MVALGWQIKFWEEFLLPPSFLYNKKRVTFPITFFCDYSFTPQKYNNFLNYQIKNVKICLFEKIFPKHLHI